MQTKDFLRSKKLYLLFFVALHTLLCSQSEISPYPVANFSFNNKSNRDNLGGIEAKLVGVRYTEDRFGNPNSAIYLYGNENSYINLGKNKLLKPRVGSISLWVNLISKVSSGAGSKINPIILTKYTTCDDFYESYSIYYNYETGILSVNCAKDSLKQMVITSKHEMPIQEWHHTVLTFDDTFIAFYLDGELQGKLVKNFGNIYLESDSVLMGVTANKRNSRFLMGSLDDVEFYDKVLTDEEVQVLYDAPNPNSNRVILKGALIVNAVLALLMLFYFFIRYRLRKKQKKEKERLELMNKLLEMELRVNRALMNPHFVYNSLYSIQSLILNEEIEQANVYLVKFSRLLRKTLESNLSDTISLESEIELLKQFIEIENLKFEGQIQSSVKTEGFSSLVDCHIPILMVQPFVENAIWHGLKNKQGDKQITILFKSINEKYVECTIDDNGTGRRKKNYQLEGNKSLAIDFIRARLVLVNKIYSLDCNLTIIDKPENSGTTIKIKIPLFGNEKFLKSDLVK
ncbi:hypothetical protein CNR22_23985 [Sphingobacteriaceae bacterium]|nr:hypothetical protein CNR22_23985 [Sphingobacteriaceae bacterium]